MIEIQSRDLERVRPLLNSVPKEVKQAMTRSVNLGALKSRTFAVRKTTNDYYIKARDIRDAINISKATYQTPQASMIVRGRQLSRIRFKVVGTTGPSRSTHPRLQIGTKKSDGMQAMENRFFQMGNNGIMHVFYRKNPSKRNPIGVDRGYSVPQMLGTKNSLEYLEEQAVPIVENEFERQIHHLLRGGR